jgi:diaminopimelate decarboxylase
VGARRGDRDRAARLRVGDMVAFGMAGAYAWNISHHDFLMHPKPDFHYLGD